MRSFTSLLALGSSLLGSSLIAACATTATTSSDDSAETAIDSADSTSSEGNMMMAATDGSDRSSFTAISVSAQVSANLGARFTPASCLTVTPSATAIKAVFDDCTGVSGLAHVTGELDLTVSLTTGGEITVHGVSSNLKVAGADLNVDATATYSSQGSAHTLTVTTTGSGTGPRGHEVDHDGSYTVSWDSSSQCRSLMGAWSTELGSSTRSNEVDITQCGTGCPTGTIVHKFLGGKALTVTFDGTATASWVLEGVAGSTSAMASGAVSLSCQ
jgi:hypothetical protein